MNILSAIARIDEFLSKYSNRNEYYLVVDKNDYNEKKDSSKPYCAEIQDDECSSYWIDDTTKAEAYGETLSDAIINLARKL